MASRKTIVRTITATTIESANITFVNGNVDAKPNAPIVVNGTITEEKALKEVRKEYGATAVVVKLSEVNDVYEISVEDFLKYAKKVENPTTEQQAEGKDEKQEGAQ